jgi:taurine dioxygenase
VITIRVAGVGELTNTVGQFTAPGAPEVGILSNVIENGRPIGLADAGHRR